MPTILVDESALDGDESSYGIVGSRPTLTSETAGGQLTSEDGNVTFRLTGYNPEYASGAYGTLTLLPSGGFSYTLQFPYFDEAGPAGRDIVSGAEIFNYEAVIAQQPNTLTVRILDLNNAIESDAPLLTNPYNGIILRLDDEETNFYWLPSPEMEGIEAYQSIVNDLNEYFSYAGLSNFSASVGEAFSIEVEGNDEQPGGTATGYDIIITESSGGVLELVELTTTDISFEPTDYYADTILVNGNPETIVAEGTISVDIRDDVPIAGDDAANIGRGSTASGNVFDNDTLGADSQIEFSESFEFSDSFALFAASPGDIVGVRAAGSDLASPASSGIGLEIQGFYGTLVLAGDGSYSYVANAELPSGMLQDRFVYTIADWEGDTDSAIITITLNRTVSTLDASITVDESALDGDESSAAFVGTRPELTTETAGGVLTVADTQAPSSSVTFELVGTGTGTNGTLTLGSNGVYSYTLEQPYLNSSEAAGRDIVTAVEAFQYRVVLDLGDGDSAVIQQGVITINVQDDIAVAFDDIASVNERQTVTGTVIANDLFGADSHNEDIQVIISEGGGVVGVRAADGNLTDPAMGGLGTPLQGQFGTLTLLADGTYSYTALENLPTGIFQDVFVYSLADREGDIDSATLTITATGINEAPVIGGSLVILASQGPRTVNFETNDPDGDDVIVLVDQPRNGNVEVGPDGSVTFGPESGFIGIGGFWLTVSDGVLRSEPADVGVLVSTRPDVDIPLPSLGFSIASIAEPATIV